jgi:hypothetical protein
MSADPQPVQAISKVKGIDLVVRRTLDAAIPDRLQIVRQDLGLKKLWNGSPVCATPVLKASKAIVSNSGNVPRGSAQSNAIAFSGHNANPREGRHYDLL